MRIITPLQALIVASLVACLAGGMAIEEATSQDVERHPRVMEPMGAVQASTSIKRLLRSSADILKNEERGGGGALNRLETVDELRPLVDTRLSTSRESLTTYVKAAMAKKVANGALKLKATVMRLQNRDKLILQWIDKKKSSDDVFKLLGLNTKKKANDLFKSPEFDTWVEFNRVTERFELGRTSIQRMHVDGDVMKSQAKGVRAEANKIRAQTNDLQNEAEKIQLQIRAEALNKNADALDKESGVLYYADMWAYFEMYHLLSRKRDVDGLQNALETANNADSHLRKLNKYGHLMLLKELALGN